MSYLNTLTRLNLIYAGNRQKRLYKKITDALKKLDRKVILKLFDFYRKGSVRVKGVPDIFIAKDDSFYFVEVKSVNDSLRVEQYEFFENYLKHVAENIFILRVLPIQ
jgi:hypothetical protein